MSMNLIFKVKDCQGYVDFPFQTPTKLTFSVMERGTREDRLSLIREFIELTPWPPDIKQSKMAEVESLINSSCLELTII